MFAARTIVTTVVTVLLLDVYGLAQSTRPRVLQPSRASQQGETETTQRIPVNTQRAKKIFERTRVLGASVVSASKGAKGVGAPITDREAWAEIAKVPAFNVIPEAERLLNEQIPDPDEEEYMKFYEESDWRKYSDINREYENKWNERRSRLFKLVLAECIENQGRFLMAIEEAILVICGEPAWTVPWDDSEAKMFKRETKRIEHNTCRTAWNLATADYWLGKKLSPNIRDLIRDTIEERLFSVFEEALLTDDYSLIPWAGDANQWNASCHSAIVGTAMALIDSPERRANYLAAAEINVEKFLQIFSRDGYFPDGAQAWNNGYGTFILLAEVFYQSTGGRIDMFKRPNIMETALYGPRMEITPNVFVSFGDHWPGDRPTMSPTAFVSKRFQMGLTEIENRAPFFGVGPTHLFMVGIYCFPNSATQRKGEAGKTITPPLETFRDDFPLGGVMILRTGKKERNQIGVQLKGGNNEERSNHSDVGSYVVALGGGTPVTDVGSRFFRRGLSGYQRMESNTYNSFGHSVPRIDDMLQKNGKGTVSPLLDRQYSDDVDLLKFDLQYVYPWIEPKDVRELTRTFIYDRTGKDSPTPGQASFKVIDTFKHRKAYTFENCIVTFGPFKKLTEDPEATSIELIVGQGDQALLVTVTNEVLEKVETDGKSKFVKHSRPLEFEASLLDEPIPRTDKQPIRLAFAFDQPVDDATMTITYRPAPRNKRDLARNDPDETTQTYISPIDEELLASEAETGTDPMEKYARLIDEIKQKLPVPLELLLQKDDDELRIQIERAKRVNPALRSLSDAEIAAIIDVLRGRKPPELTKDDDETPTPSPDTPMEPSPETTEPSPTE